MKPEPFTSLDPTRAERRRAAAAACALPENVELCRRAREWAQWMKGDVA